MGIFQYIGNWINSLFVFLKSSSNTDVVQILSTFVGITITIQVMIKAYQVMAGKSDSPTQELIWDMTIKMLLISIALNLNGFLDTIKLSMEELHNLMSGNKNLYAVLDEKLNSTLNLISSIWNKYNILDSSSSIFATGLAIILVFASFLLGIVPSFLIIITTDITLKLLMLIAPIIIFARAYSWGKQVFDQWISIFVTNLLTIFIVGTLLNLFIERYGDFIAISNENLKISDVTHIGFESLLMGILLFSLMKLAVKMAEKIGSVSIEVAPKSSTNINDSINGKGGIKESYQNLGSSAGNTYSGTKTMYQDTKDYIKNKI